jgi:secreted PhoX family phosphatase
MTLKAVPAFAALALVASATVGCQADSDQSSSGQSASLSSSNSTATRAATPAGNKHIVATQFVKPGFVTFVEDGRLWIFKDGSKELAAFEKSGELAKHVVIPGQGPHGMTVKAPDRDVVLEYMCAKPGFVAMAMDGRVWIFEDGSKSFEEFRSNGELAKHIVRPGAGPMRSTLRAPDAATLDAWAFSQPGFVTIVEDGRLWIFRADSKELAEYRKSGELAKHIVRPGAGPNRMTVKAPDAATADAYLAMAN